MKKAFIYSAVILSIASMLPILADNQGTTNSKTQSITPNPLESKEKEGGAVEMPNSPQPTPPAAAEKKPEAGQKADVTISIDNVREESKPGYKRWDFDWVFTEHNGVGVTFDEYEMTNASPISGAKATKKEKMNFRVDPHQTVRSPGNMWIKAEGLEEKFLHETMHTKYKGVDDNGNPIEVENYFFQ